MKTFLGIVSIFSLALTIVPALLVFTTIIDVALHRTLMLAGMVLWFIAAPAWLRMNRS